MYVRCMLNGQRPPSYASSPPPSQTQLMMNRTASADRLHAAAPPLPPPQGASSATPAWRLDQTSAGLHRHTRARQANRRAGCPPHTDAGASTCTSARTLHWPREHAPLLEPTTLDASLLQPQWLCRALRLQTEQSGPNPAQLGLRGLVKDAMSHSPPPLSQPGLNILSPAGSRQPLHPFYTLYVLALSTRPTIRQSTSKRGGLASQSVAANGGPFFALAGMAPFSSPLGTVLHNSSLPRTPPHLVQPTEGGEPGRGCRAPFLWCGLDSLAPSSTRRPVLSRVLPQGAGRSSPRNGNGLIKGCRSLPSPKYGYPTKNCSPDLGVSHMLEEALRESNFTPQEVASPGSPVRAFGRWHLLAGRRAARPMPWA